MSKRIKYMIFYGLVGVFISWIVYRISSVITWLFIIGDGPSSSAQKSVALVIVFGTVIGSWLLTVYLGYRQGIDAENNINTPSSIPIKKTIWSALKIIAIIMIVGIVFLLVIFLVGNTRKNNNALGTTTLSTGNQRNYDIMNFMEEARIYATYCNDEKREIVSANGGDKFCDEGAAYNSIRRLRQINFCGDKPVDTKWIVTNGKSSDWTMELNCKNFTTCNGKNNAYCNTNGCTFGKDCDPRKK